MSRYSSRQPGVTITQILGRKSAGQKISAITCYDAAFARLIDQTAIDIVLVGDSMGNVMLGYENTIPVTIGDICHHTAAVGRVLSRPFLCSDMPFLSYHLSCEQALSNAGILVQKGGAQAVKLEGGRKIAAQVKAIVDAGIPVMGHLGLTPQSVHTLGGYKIQGRGEKAAQALLDDAKALEDAGAFSLVLEMVPRELAKKVTDAVHIPTIGIGAGPACDGQIIVLHDILGFEEEFNPKFLKKYANVGKIVREAVTAYDQEVKAGAFPTASHSFSET
jgi:3-methyl-2-oxobutanoate hydroxymethyltransferase